MDFNMYQISQINAFQDNYIWAIHDDTHCALIDPGEAQPCLLFLEQSKLILTDIFITHHHPDHIGGVKELITQFPETQIYGPSTQRFEHLVTHPVVNGSEIQITPSSLKLNVIDLSGHTNDHVGYVSNKEAFVGDTLFSMGCGRLFEGSAEQMWHSLHQLYQLPDSYLIYCAHEYTLANIEFALAVLPQHQAIMAYQQHVQTLLAQGKASVPMLLAKEKQLNPFLNCHNSNVQSAISNKFKLSKPVNEIETFRQLRKWKDNF